MDDLSFRNILNFFDLSWPGYRRVRKAVKRRLAGHMLECGCRSVKDYLLFLRSNPGAMEKARELLTVSISRFFRDLLLWEVMERTIIPALVRDAHWSGQEFIRAWSAGCSCGEEVYSLKILWEQAGRRAPDMPTLEVWATDFNPLVLEKARIGVYPQSSLKNLPASVVSEYFTPTSDGFSIQERLQKGIHWIKHDFISETPPAPALDIIFLRNNLLTYYGPPSQERPFLKIVTSLRTGGFLIIGNNEALPLEEVPLKRCSEYRSIYVKAE
jgi:chemotaxis methyl-accepting protein methylase